LASLGCLNHPEHPLKAIPARKHDTRSSKRIPAAQSSLGLSDEPGGTLMMSNALKSRNLVAIVYHAVIKGQIKGTVKYPATSSRTRF
jgi:hypothetical protein